jgi:hypothetical protein
VILDFWMPSVSLIIFEPVPINSIPSNKLITLQPLPTQIPLINKATNDVNYKNMNKEKETGNPTLECHLSPSLPDQYFMYPQYSP